MRGAGSKSRPAKAGRGQAAAQNLCEDFAPRNEAARLCEERGANRAPQKPAGGRRRREICVKILLPETELQGFARSGAQNLHKLNYTIKTHEFQRSKLVGFLNAELRILPDFSALYSL